jgi:HlyD family secretion protein
MKKKRNIIITLGVAVIIIVGVIVLTSSKGTDTVYRTVKVERGNVSVVVTATGTLSAVTTVQVGTQVSGTIARLFADFNSVVKKGQIIAIIDTTFLRTQVEDAEASYDRAVAQANQAERDFNRTQDLFKKNLVSQADFDAAKANYETAVAQKKSAQAALNRANINLKYATIRAPIDGVVISRNVDVGQTVAASLQAPTLFVIANDLTKMQVQANIDEADIGKIHVGQDVKFTVDAYPDQQFKGKVSQVRLQPNVVQNVVNYTVIVEVPNPDLKLMPGMTATITVSIDQREDVLKLPNLALRFQPSASELEAWRRRVESDTARARGMSARTPSEDSSKIAEFRARQQSSQGQRGGGNPGGGPATFDGRSGGRGGWMTNRNRVWVLDEKKMLKAVPVRLGLTDGTNSEIVGGPLKEGDEVIVGISSSDQPAAAQRSPFAPQGPGGGRRF